MPYCAVKSVVGCFPLTRAELVCKSHEGKGVNVIWKEENTWERKDR